MNSTLIKLYNNPNRFHHNLKHILDCLNEFNLVKELTENPKALKNAIWYHDAIYDTHAKDNEEQSAKLAYNFCIEKNQSIKFANRVSNLILATKHSVLPKNIDEKIIVDIDLSILGKSPEEFAEYEKNIRKEYSWVFEQEFKQGRKTILESFLKRPSIYSTEQFQNKYETQAQENLKQSIIRLN